MDLRFGRFDMQLEALKATNFGTTAIYPDSPEYERKRRVWNGLIDRRPSAIVQASAIDDILEVVAVAKRTGLALAVRGGGHSLPGLSTCDDGLVLDLSQLNSIVVDPIAQTASVEGGALLGNLDAAGAPHGLVVPAGVVSHTGAAGLTLGGGMGWLSRRFGLTIDSLRSAEIITANGDVIRASDENEPELFWGIRGGGGNFGIVTKFHFAMHKLGVVSAGSWEYEHAHSRTALFRLADLAKAAPREFTAVFNVTKVRLSVTAFHSGVAQGGDELLASFGQLAGAGIRSYGSNDFLAFQSRSDEHVRWGRRTYAKGGYLDALDGETIDCMIAAVKSSPSPDSEIYVIQLGGAISDISDDATAYTGRAAQFYWIVQPIWDDAEFDVACLAWGRKIAAQMTAFSMEGNYVNEQADYGGELALKAYGAQKFRRLQKLKARFDPDNLFKLNQNIVPKV
jgi:FAD/FMN-containing dehydrogenase